MPVSPSRSTGATPDYIEAAVRAGEAGKAAAALEPYLAWSARSGTPGLPALAARSRALLASAGDPAAADALFGEALSRHAGTSRPFDHARTQLLYGEFLRRGKRRTQARTQLRAALDTFTRLGAPVWARRAEGELRATGETARERDPNALLELTPQELQIAQAVGEGATNREIASQLFISPRTVDYHLGKVFRKLNISSRRDLIRLSTSSAEGG